jgi:hypothetical protein
VVLLELNVHHIKVIYSMLRCLNRETSVLGPVLHGDDPMKQYTIS